MNGARRYALGPTPLRLAAFAALAALVATQWARLVEVPPAGRVALTVGLSVAGAGALALIAARRRAPVATTALAAVAVLIVIAAGLVAVGVPARLLEPGGWAELMNRIGRGFSGMTGDVDYPYGGANAWTRIVILAGLPVALGLAAAIAFWPRGESAPARRTAGLLVLAATLGFATVVVAPGHALLWGLLLLLAIGAWRWLPSLSARDAIAGAGLLAVAGALALPISGALDRGEPLIDVREWRFGRGATDKFNWNHTYGRLDWPRSGTALAAIETPERQYWKTAVLTEFAGTRWREARRPTGTRAELPTQVEGTDPAATILRQRHPEWFEGVSVTFGPMESRFVLAPGELISVDGVDDVVARPDGSTISGGGPLERHDSYSALAYVPDPSPRQLRNAPRRYPPALARFTELTLPGDAKAKGPYAPTYRLARRLTDGETPYGAVQSIQRYLGSGFTYSEDPPRRRYPLPAFLSKDRVGYCQQFSGAMALMLRMAGIPSRVVSGFSPGSPDPENEDRFLVEDLDAHSWVEVYFPTIGWVTFDPTPASAPAAGRSPDTRFASAGAIDDLGSADGLRRKGFTPPKPQQASAAAGGGLIPLWLVPAGLGGLALLGLAAGAGAMAARHIRYRRLSPAAALEAHLRELPPALARLDWPIRPGETLLTLERRLSHDRKPAAARYTSKLRTARFSATDPERPSLTDRRALRDDLTTTGLGSRLSSLLVLPPGGPH